VGIALLESIGFVSLEVLEGVLMLGGRYGYSVERGLGLSWSLCITASISILDYFALSSRCSPLDLSIDL
jgi:hypothetical protein